MLKIRGLWRQTDEAGGDSSSAEKTVTHAVATTSANKTGLAKKLDEIPIQPKLAIKKDDKLLKAFNPVQGGTR